MKLKQVNVLVYTVEEIIAKACESLVLYMVGQDCSEWKSCGYDYIAEGVSLVRKSVKEKELRNYVTKNVIGRPGPSYFMIPEVEESDVDYCYVVYPDGERFKVDFYC